MSRLLLFLLSSICVLLITIFFRLGGHKSVEINYAEYPELHLLFKEHQGPYHKINDVIVSVETWASSQNIPCPRTFGEYFDDPRTTDERQLRSLGGCVLTTPFTAEALPADLKYKIIPAQKYVVATFSGAPSIGPLKVYPKVEDFIFKNKLRRGESTIEIYNIINTHEAKTEFLFTIQP